MAGSESTIPSAQPQWVHAARADSSFDLAAPIRSRGDGFGSPIRPRDGACRTIRLPANGRHQQARQNHLGSP